jgi:hypothetical protein
MANRYPNGPEAHDVLSEIVRLWRVTRDDAMALAKEVEPADGKEG